MPEVIPVLRDDAFLIPSQEEFYRLFRLSDSILGDCGISWGDLVEIGRAHLAAVPELRQTGNYIAERIRELEAVHSVKVRIKDPAHLMEKIVRKKREDSSRNITDDNYRQEITDLIGIRALHLFKAEWLPIHRFITSNWNLLEKPRANVRAGDASRLLEMFRAEGCEVREHPAGYRSVHYLITSQPAKKAVAAELQVRTIFEEGWSEIDHRVRYPYETDNAVLGELLEVFNRLAGGADEMGSFVEYLKATLARRDTEAASVAASYEETVRTLKEQIAALKIDSREKRELEKRVRELENRSTTLGNTVTVTSKGSSDLAYPYLSVGAPERYASLSTLGYVGPSDSLLGTTRVPNSILTTSLGTLVPTCKNCGETIAGGFTAISSQYCGKCSPGLTVGGR